MTLAVATLLSGAALIGFIESYAAMASSVELANIGFTQRDSLLALVGEQSGVRGYVASGDPRFLDAYDAGRRQFAYDAGYLTSSDRRFPDMQLRLPKTLAVAAQLREYYTKEIVTAREGDRARAVSRLAAGRTLFARYSALDDRTQQRVFRALNLARSRALEMVLTASTLLVVTLILFAIIGMRFVYLLRRGARIERQAFCDPLTGLANRRAFMSALEQGIADACRANSSFAVALLDLDGFKNVNDTFGHAAGDTVLRMTAARLVSELRGEDTVARIGGDEFAILLGGLENTTGASIARRMTQIVANPVQVESGRCATVTASIGFAYFPDDARDADGLLAIADAAMYEHKERERTRFRTSVAAATDSRALEAVLSASGPAFDEGNVKRP